MPRLRIHTSDGREHEALIESVASLGRSTLCDVVLSDANVSRRHAEILRRDGRWMIRDLGSDNGTFVDGERVEETPLRHGAQIELGRSVLVFGLDDTSPVARFEDEDDTSAAVRASVPAEAETSASAVAAFRDRDRMLRAVEAIERVSHALHHARSAQGLFSSMTRELLWAYPCCECCHVLSWGAGGKELRLEASQSRSGGAPAEATYSRTVVHRAIEAKQGVLGTSEGLDALFRDSTSVRALGIRSFVCAPILVAGEPQGAIYLDSRQSNSTLGEADLRVLCVVANEAGLALQNLQLLNQLVEKQRMETSLKMARTIQSQVVPRQAPTPPGFEIAGMYVPCDETSGDYYDFLDLPHGRLGLVVGDVSGHGVGSALLMMSARSLLRALAACHNDVGQIMGEMNRLMAADTHEGMWMSLFYGVLDPLARSITYFSAGHEPALLWRASSGRIETLCSSTYPMGVVAEMPPQRPERVLLRKGDILVLCTDGIAEAQNADNELFGRDRLSDAVAQRAAGPPAAVVDGVLEAVESFRGDAPLRDDITIVAVKATGQQGQA